MLMNVNHRNLTVCLFVSLLSCSRTVWGCPECVALVKSGIYNQNSVGNLIVLLLPVAVLIAISLGIYFMEPIRARLRKGADS